MTIERTGGDALILRACSPALTMRVRLCVIHRNSWYQDPICPGKSESLSKPSGVHALPAQYYCHFSLGCEFELTCGKNKSQDCRKQV